MKTNTNKTELLNETIRKEQYLIKNQLKERGWTEKLIRDFLGEPDKNKWCGNKHYGGVHICKLYASERILKAETLPEFIEYKNALENVRAKRQMKEKQNEIK